jgi:hypothetical protein
MPSKTTGGSRLTWSRAEPSMKLLKHLGTAAQIRSGFYLCSFMRLGFVLG